MHRVPAEFIANDLHNIPKQAIAICDEYIRVFCTTIATDLLVPSSERAYIHQSSEYITERAHKRTCMSVRAEAGTKLPWNT